MRLITISHPDRMSVIPDHKIAITLQLKTEASIG
ncbi:Uncharacterised protein [Paucimonas lemoignei]|nr:Uncharacterised protein [Paucimonas lemoignei]